MMTITIHHKRNRSGKLVYFSIEGIPASWTDWTFKQEIFYDEAHNGPLAPIAPFVREVKDGFVDLSDYHDNERVYVDEA